MADPEDKKDGAEADFGLLTIFAGSREELDEALERLLARPGGILGFTDKHRDAKDS